MNLTKNFKLEEFTKSQTASRKGIDNTPDDKVIKNLKVVSKNICQRVRDSFNRPVYINSGYRSEELNTAIGGSTNSQHIIGQAVDMEIPGVTNYDQALWIRDNLDFDQLILEAYTPGVLNSGWVHCSYKNPEKNRKEVLTATFENGTVTYSRGLNK